MIGSLVVSTCVGVLNALAMFVEETGFAPNQRFFVGVFRAVEVWSACGLFSGELFDGGPAGCFS
jgi:hypothetical protein